MAAVSAGKPMVIEDSAGEQCDFYLLDHQDEHAVDTVLPFVYTARVSAETPTPFPQTGEPGQSNEQLFLEDVSGDDGTTTSLNAAYRSRTPSRPASVNQFVMPSTPSVT